MEILSKISKGSKMDQIYIPKNRNGFSIGEYVLILPLESRMKIEKEKIKPFFYNIKTLETIKLRLIGEIFDLIDKKISSENIIITGSFLEKGFNFNDIDIIILTERKVEIEDIKNKIESLTGIKTHLLLMDNKSLFNGLSADPLYQMMLSKCISKKRLIYKVQRKINYKILDLHLLKSKILVDNFDILNGNEKYYLTMNLISILLFLKNKKLSREKVDKEIKILLNVEAKKIKENLINKPDFLKKYKKVYDKTFKLILKSIKNE